MTRLAFVFVCVLGVSAHAAAQPEQPPEQPAEQPAGVDASALALCDSSDVNARRFCLTSIEERGDSQGIARERLSRMASSDAELHQEAADLYRRLYSEEPPTYAAPVPPPPPQGYTDTPEQLAVPGEPPPEPEHPRRSAGDPTRVIYTPTAFTRPEGDVSINFFQAGTFTLDYGATEDITVGFRSAIPIGFVTVSGIARVGFEFEGGSVGLHAEAGVFVPFAFDTDGEVFLLYGGGPMLTLGNDDNYFNIGLNAFGGTITSIGSAGIIAPTIGGSVRVAGPLRINLEIHTGGVFNADGDFFWLEGVIAMVGVRIFGGQFWGDIALIQPLFENGFEVYEVIPLGIPFLNFGAQF